MAIGNTPSGHGHTLPIELRNCVDVAPPQIPKRTGGVEADTQIGIYVSVDSALEGRQQSRRIEFAGSKNVNPTFALDLVFVCHNDNTAAEIEDVVP